VREDRPSLTAAWVATCRGLAGLLPPGEQLCDDALGLRFGGPAAEALALAARQTPRATWFWFRMFWPAALSLYWVQLRTRAIDEMLLRFVERGGKQVVLLGAGYDTRAVRLRPRLAGATVFEVDHPATQSRKRRLLGAAASGAPIYLPWDFERDRMEDLPVRLVALGHDPREPTFTLWEGVTMYLSERAIERTVASVRAASAPGSQLAFEYFRRASITERAGLERIVANAVIMRDEPFRFGWEPAELPAWLVERGFTLEVDRGDADLARQHLSPDHLRMFQDVRGTWEFHLALARRR
jgi:methyltransferase (TIGR00027 family)